MTLGKLRVGFPPPGCRTARIPSVVSFPPHYARDFSILLFHLELSITSIRSKQHATRVCGMRDGRERRSFMIPITGIRIDQLMADGAERNPHGRVEVLTALPIHPDAQYTWRVRVPGRGVYMGPADEYTNEKGEKYISFANPDTLIPEN